MTYMNPRLRTLRARFIALIAASATALGLIAASAVPSRAEIDNRDIGKLLIGLAAIALIAKAVEDRDDDDDDQGPPVVVEPERGHKKRIPAACRIDVSGFRNDRVAYSENCLASYGINRLPRHCAHDARVFGRPDRLYPASCLREAGFRLGR